MRQKGDKERKKRERLWMKFIRKRNNTVTLKKEILCKIYRRYQAQFTRNHVAKMDNRKSEMHKIQFNCK